MQPTYLRDIPARIPDSSGGFRRVSFEEVACLRGTGRRLMAIKPEALDGSHKPN